LKITLSKNKENFSKFLPLENSTNFLPPKIKAYSYRSDLYHEKMIENIANITLNKIAHKINSQEKNFEEDSSFKGKKNKIQKEKEIEIPKEKSKTTKKLKASDLDLKKKEELIKKLEKRTHCKIFDYLIEKNLK